MPFEFVSRKGAKEAKSAKKTLFAFAFFAPLREMS